MSRELHLYPVTNSKHRMNCFFERLVRDDSFSDQRVAPHGAGQRVGEHQPVAVIEHHGDRHGHGQPIQGHQQVHLAVVTEVQASVGADDATRLAAHADLVLVAEDVRRDADAKQVAEGDVSDLAGVALDGDRPQAAARQRGRSERGRREAPRDQTLVGGAGGVLVVGGRHRADRRNDADALLTVVT